MPGRCASSAGSRGQRRGDALVGVEREDPVVRGQAGGEVLLIDVAGPGARLDARAFGAAMATVSSVLPESTTMISSAQAALSMAAAMCRFVERDDGDRDTRHGGHRNLTRDATRYGPARFQAAAYVGRDPDRRCAPRGRRPAAERHFLHGLEVDDRLVVVEDRAQLVVARLREVALGLEDEEARGRAGLELALLGLEPPLGQLPRRACRLHALLVGLHLRAPARAPAWRPAAAGSAAARLRLAVFQRARARLASACWCRSDS